MFLRSTKRKKKEHRYYSLVENKRLNGGRIVQRHALYLGEINDTQRPARIARSKLSRLVIPGVQREIVFVEFEFVDALVQPKT